jgi:hypothetical protein
MANTSQYVADIVRTVGAWDGIAVNPHRFGGSEFNFGKVEIGHIHNHGMVDIPFTVKLREQLVKEGRAGLHHLLKDSGWITVFVRNDADRDNAIWLFRLSYMQKTSRRMGTPIDAEADALNLSDGLRSILQGRNNEPIHEGETES